MPQRCTRPTRGTHTLPAVSRFCFSLAVALLASISNGCRESESTTVGEAESGAACPVKSSDQAVTNSIGMELVHIPAGVFQMGTSAAAVDVRADETSRHYPFVLSGSVRSDPGRIRTGVSRAEKLFPMADGGGKTRVRQMETASFPAELVKWVDAVEFCKRLSARPAERAAGRSYRLPTEAEWEYACRAGPHSAFHFGDSLSSTQAIFIGSEPFGDAAPGPFLNPTTTVGSYPPNAFGLYDMQRNVCLRPQQQRTHLLFLVRPLTPWNRQRRTDWATGRSRSLRAGRGQTGWRTASAPGDAV